MRDLQENLTISWTPAGKIAHIIQGTKQIKITFAYDPVANRISKTISKLTGTDYPKTTYYTPAAQGNTIAAYENAYEKTDTIPCDYTAQTTLDLMRFIYNGYVSEVITIGVSNPNMIDQLDTSFHTRILNQSSGICDSQARAYLLSILPVIPDPIVYPIIDNNIIQNIKIETDNAYTASQDLQSTVSYIQSMYPGEDPNSIEAGVTYFYNLNVYPTQNPIQDLLSQGYTKTTHIIAGSADSFYWREQHLYGSSRLGMHTPNREIGIAPSASATDGERYTGMRQYELTNHLGNGLATIKDGKT